MACRSRAGSIAGRAKSRGLIVYVHGGPTAHSEDRITPIDPVLGAPRLHCARSELSRLDRLRPGLSRGDQAATAGAGASRTTSAPASRRCSRAGIAQPGQDRHHRHLLWRLFVLVRDHALADLVLAAAAPICGMTDLVVDYQTTRPACRPYSEEMLGGTPNAGARPLSRALADPTSSRTSRASC